MNKKSIIITALCIGLIIMATLGPYLLTRYYDDKIIGKVHVSDDPFYMRTPTFDMTIQEKLLIVAGSLESAALPQSDFFALVKNENNAIQPTSTYPYNYMPMYDGDVYDFEVTKENVFEKLQAELDKFQNAGVIPYFNIEEDLSIYDAELYSALDISSPDMSVALWQIKFNKNKPLAQLKNVLTEAYIDAMTGQLYFFSLRTDSDAGSYNHRDLVDFWHSYLTLEAFERIEDKSISTHGLNTGQYDITIIGDEHIKITAGHLENINESFIKISR